MSSTYTDRTAELQSGQWWLIRGTAALFLGVLLFQSWRIAWADILSESGREGSIEKAISLEPDNFRFRVRKASREMLVEGGSSGNVEAELEIVLKQYPWNSEALMDMGVVAEEKGNTGQAEQFLLLAANHDHTFKPAWTLANFYYRKGQTEKMWPEIRKALDVISRPSLEYFDPTIVYDLCWQAGADSKLVLALVPDQPTALLGYFVYCVLYKHLNAASEVYPKVLPIVDASVKMYRDRFISYCVQLSQAGRIPESVQVWNQLVDNKIIKSTLINPVQGQSIANASFWLPLDPEPFGWYGPNNEHITITSLRGNLRLDFDGQQPSGGLVLEKNIALLANTNYRITWKADEREIEKPLEKSESGLTLRFYHDTHQIPSTCTSFLIQKSEPFCRFHVPPESVDEKLVLVNMKLTEERLPGTVKLLGTLHLSSFRSILE